MKNLSNKTMIRITKAFKFEMAHALHGYDGLCKNIHGHSYRLWVTIRGELKHEKGHKKDGMVMDFDDIKKIIIPEIVDRYDHSLVLNANSPHAEIDLAAFEKVFYLPSYEIVRWIAPVSSVPIFGVEDAASRHVSNIILNSVCDFIYQQSKKN